MKNTLFALGLFLLFILTFLFSMSIINLKEYLKSPKYNRWINGKVDSIEVGGEDEIWTIKWSAPSNLKEKNPEGEQNYYFKFKHRKNFNNIDERRNYINDKSFKNIGNKFYLSLRVDSNGIIREIGNYDGSKGKLIGYSISTLIFIAIALWLY